MSSSCAVSCDGYQWTPEGGLQHGLGSISVIVPSANLPEADSQSTIFDVIVIGAGYAGLVAARDLAINGLRVLLLEGRDRIGGRTWSACVDGQIYDLGGSWISPEHANLWAELSRYDMMDEVELASVDPNDLPRFTLKADGGVSDFTAEEQNILMDSALTKFFDVDGANGRTAIPFPYDEREFVDQKYGATLTLAERLHQLEHSLTSNEKAALSGMMCLCSGTILSDSSFSEVLHWWALCGYSSHGFIKNLRTYKLSQGQSSLAIRMFKEVLSTGNLSYAFRTSVSAVRTSGEVVEVRTTSGKTFSALEVVSAVPYNALDAITFDPLLSWSKRPTTERRNINHGAKSFFECSDSTLRSWSGIAYPQDLLNYVAAIGSTANGHTIIEAFGHVYGKSLDDRDPSKYLAILKDMAPANIRRIVSHDWDRDEFSRGGWFHPQPGANPREYRPIRNPAGKVHFASSDWASGWRGFIDGAIEQGRRIAYEVQMNLIGCT